MTFLKNKTIRTKLLVLFLSISVIPLIIVGAVTYSSFKQAVTEEVESTLNVSAYAKKIEIENYLNRSKLDAEIIAQTADIRSAIDRLVLYHNEMGILPDGNYDVSSIKKITTKIDDNINASGTVNFVTENAPLTETYDEISKSINGFLKTYIEKYNYDDIYLICEKHGHIMYSANKSADLGENIGVGQFKDGILAEAWNEAKKGNIYITDIKPCNSHENAPMILVAAPIYQGGEIVSVVALRLSQEHINKIMNESTGMGNSGNSYLVGRDGYFRSNSRLTSESTLLKTKVDSTGFKTVLDTKKEFNGSYGNFESEANAKVRNADYSEKMSGVPVLGMNLYLPDYDWVLMTEMDQSEAFQGVYDMQNVVIGIIFIVIAIALLILFYFSRSINNILRSSISQMISSANSLSATAQQNSAASQQTSSISQQVATGASSQSKQAEEISRAISSMASSIQQMAASAEEASSTADESSNMTQSAGQSSEKSKSSLDNIKKIVSNTAVMTRNMSSKSKEIGDIVETITGIAKQTNLLALNANIEAARAGEAGRGFAVVADEVRKLAEGSSDAADRIKTLITDMMSSIEEAANAAETGMVSVEESSAIINSTIGSLQNISTSVMQVSSKIQELSAGIQQQAASTQQIARNMDSIVSISEQNSAGAQQLSATTQQQSSANQQVAAAAQQLQALSNDLIRLVETIDSAAENNLSKKINEKNSKSKDRNIKNDDVNNE